MELGISGKVALVTGGSRGIGLACAELFARESCRVVVCGRGRERLDHAVARLHEINPDTTGYTADITDQTEIVSLFDRMHNDGLSPDIMVFNNAGPPNNSFDDAKEEDYLVAYKRIVLGFAWCAKNVAPVMKERRWGRIVTLGSMCVKEPHRELPLVLHNLTRPAAAGLSKTLSDELGEYGITVNTIGIGSVDTGDEEGAFRLNYRAAARERGISYEDMKAERLAPVPLKRAGTAEEVASLCGFLSSDVAGYITGQTILIDGGRTRAFL